MSLKSKIQALLTFSNETTKAEDTTLGAAVKRLADGYGQGGGDDVLKSLIDKSITTITIPSSTKAIGAYAFFSCVNLTEVIFNEGLTTLNDSCFYACTSLTSVVLPSTLNKIMGFVFRSDSNITELTFKSVIPPSLNANAFVLMNGLAHIYVPADSVDAYKAANVWSNYADIISAIEE